MTNHIDPVRAVEALARRAIASRNVGIKTTDDPAATTMPVKATPAVKRDRGDALPSWPSDVRGVPNPILRSALFGALARGRRRAMEREAIPTIGNHSIVYTGHRLDQGDLDVWECVLHFASTQATTQCRFTAYAILQMLGRTDTGGNRQVLDARLSRLKATAVCIMAEVRYPEVSLIDRVERDRHSREYRVTLNEEMQALFAPDRYTRVDWAIRRELQGKPLAQWLHGFYSSHAAPRPMSVETIYRLCGSEATRLYHFRRELLDALEDLKAVLSVHHQSFRFALQDDVVHIERTPTRAQGRHLARRMQANA